MIIFLAGLNGKGPTILSADFVWLAGAYKRVGALGRAATINKVNFSLTENRIRKILLIVKLNNFKFHKFCL